MTIDLPSNGCNVFYGTYLDNYYSGIRTRYYFNNNILVESSHASYTVTPTGVHCVTTGDLLYNPEAEIYFSAISLAVVVLAAILLYKIIVKRLLP